MRDFFTSLKRPALGAALGAVLGLLAFGPVAQAANPFELNFWLSGPRYDGRVAACEAAHRHHRFAVPGEGKQLLEFQVARRSTADGLISPPATAFRPWASPNSIPRRYCSADVMLSDGKVRTV